MPAPRPGSHLRQMSNSSSIASSFAESAPGSFQAGSGIPSAHGSGLDLPASAEDTPGTGTPAIGTPSHEPMLNFRSLAAVIDNRDKDGHGDEHIENAEPLSPAEEEVKEPSPEGNRSRGDSGESSSSAPPPVYVESPPDGDEITPAPIVSREVDKKEIHNVNILDRGQEHEATQ